MRPFFLFSLKMHKEGNVNFGGLADVEECIKEDDDQT